MTDPRTSESKTAAAGDGLGAEGEITDQERQMQALEDLAASLDSTSIDPSASPAARAGDAPARGAAARAGRRQIGLSVPAGAAVGPAAVVQKPSPTVHLQKTLTALESRLVAVLCDALPAGDSSLRAAALCEVALLSQVRRTAVRQLADPPSDVLMCENIVDFAEEVASTIADLSTPGQRRATRLLAFVRGLAAQLAAFGGEVAPHKAALARARAELEAKGEQAATSATTVACDLFGKIQEQLDSVCPAAAAACLLDDILAAR